ncbi:glutamate racemase [Paludibacter sp.]
MKEQNKLTQIGPIGIFDSGYGGLTILENIRKVSPQYDYVYLGDNARTPYGTRSFDVVYQYTLECVKKLFSMGCRLVILACNTASAKALRSIQQIDLPIIAPDRRVLGIIRPTVEVLNQFTANNHVGVFATPGTVQSESYQIETKKIHPEIKLSLEACPMWVPLIENNEHLSKGADYFVEKHINNLLRIDPQIDSIILGCTHYPLLQPMIRKFLPSRINIVSQGEIVAESLKSYLQRHQEIDEKCSKNGGIVYYTTESAEKFIGTASIFLNRMIEAERISI